MSTDSGIHSGHRARMRERFLVSGLDNFRDHEALELLLYNAIPRKDINELAHSLIEHFGSFRAVFDADYDELCAINGVGKGTAVYIKMLTEFYRRYALSGSEAEYVYDELYKVGEYAVRLYIGVSVEKVYAMLFDNQMKLLDTVMLAEGAVNAVRVSGRMITERAIKKGAATIILIHNHPNGTPYPSPEDIKFSRYLYELLDKLDIYMAEHVIVSGRFYRPVLGKDNEKKLAAASIPFKYNGEAAPDGVRIADFLIEIGDW